MLEEAFNYTLQALNQFLSNRFGLDESIAVSNTLVDASGNIPTNNQNKLVLSLINIEQETNKPFHKSYTTNGDGEYVKATPSQRYKLHVLLSANFDDYREALKFLNAGMLFFQIYAVLDATRHAFSLGKVEKLEFEMENISFNEMHSLWNALGAKYQPSAVFRMRMITIGTQEMTAAVPAIRQVETNTIAYE
jgi:hypothetical protein